MDEPLEEACAARRAFCSSAVRLSRMRVPDGEMCVRGEWATVGWP